MAYQAVWMMQHALTQTLNSTHYANRNEKLSQMHWKPVKLEKPCKNFFDFFVIEVVKYKMT